MLKRLYVPNGRAALTIRRSYQRSTSSQSHMAICAPILPFLQSHQAVCPCKGIQWWWSDPTCHAPAYSHCCRTRKSIERESEEATLGPSRCYTVCVQTIDSISGCATEKVMCILQLVSSHGHGMIVIHQQSRETWNFQWIYHCLMILRKIRVFYFFLKVTAYFFSLPSQIKGLWEYL